MKKILYLSLTGMTEPLGRSQVLEYLLDLSQQHKFFLISFERESDAERVPEIESLIASANIEWYYFNYSNRYRALSSIGQIIKAVIIGARLIRKNNISLVHARGFIPAVVGMLLRKTYRVKLLFDIRGFAIDEKVDGGRLKRGSLFFRVLKYLESYLYKVSDHIVVLTHKAKEILVKENMLSARNISVIPTCANPDIFQRTSALGRSQLRESLGYDSEDIIVIHTGTVGGWYDFRKELRFVKAMICQNQRVHFLLLNRGEHDYISLLCKEEEFPADKIRVLTVSFDEVRDYLSIADFSIFFITPSFAKQASLPTKFAENVSCKLVSITNSDVGDMDFYLQKYNVGYVFDLTAMENGQYESMAQQVLTSNSVLSRRDFSQLFAKYFDKAIALKKYQGVFAQLIDSKK